MAKIGHSKPDLLGGYTHYDEHGKKTGHSEPDLFGSYANYDAKGKRIGHSERDLLGGYVHYDAKGKRIGSTEQDAFGGYTHRDAKGKVTGMSTPGILGSYDHRTSEGCYIATCVYGSYDCPEVLVLRRFRDEILLPTRFGRCFVKWYYRLSPGLVARCGDKSWFVKSWKMVLDMAVSRLR